MFTNKVNHSVAWDGQGKERFKNLINVRVLRVA